MSDPENFIEVQLVTIKTGERTDFLATTMPGPGLTVFCNVSQEYEVRIRWPLKKKKVKG